MEMSRPARGIEGAADMVEHTQGRLDIGFREACKGILTDAARDTLEAPRDGSAAGRQHDCLGPAVRGLLPPRDEAYVSSEFRRRTTEEPSSDRDAASSFWRMGPRARARRSSGSQVASVKPKGCM